MELASNDDLVRPVKVLNKEHSDKIAAIIKDVMFPSEHSGMAITLFTGIGGMINFDWCMMGIKGEIPYSMKMHIYRPTKRFGSPYIISIGPKQGRLKIVIQPEHKDKLSFRIGTEEVFRSNNLSDVAVLIKLWKDIQLTLPI